MPFVMIHSCYAGLVEVGFLDFTSIVRGNRPHCQRISCTTMAKGDDSLSFISFFISCYTSNRVIFVNYCFVDDVNEYNGWTNSAREPRTGL